MPNRNSFGFLLICGAKYISYSLSIYKSDHLRGKNLLYASTFHMQRKPLKIVCIWRVDHCDNKRFKQQDISLLSVTSSNFVHCVYTIRYFQGL